MNKECKLFKIIPREKLNHLFKNSTASAELDYSFLGFENIYKAVLMFVPKNKIIIDFGCAYATQSYFFIGYKKYIGIDIQMTNDSVIHTDNSKFYHMTIQKFVNEVFPTLGYRQDEVFAICSYVPDKEARELVRFSFDYCLVCYP